MKNEIILFYKYVTIENPKELMDSQRALCEELGMLGRLIIAEEGVNGTFEGSVDAIKKYEEALREDTRFADIQIKRSEGTEDMSAFPRLQIRVRDEIITTRLPKNVDPTKDTGTYLEPDELQKWYEEGKDFVVVDMRNDYEVDSGYFEKTVPSGMKNFHEIGTVADRIKDLKDKTVLTVCTGGVRCEKASAYLKKEGFKNVYQLHGGMHKYMEKYPGKHFKGTLYVFDGRMTTDLGADNREKVGACRQCGEKSERYINCAHTPCHLQMIQC